MGAPVCGISAIEVQLPRGLPAGADRGHGRVVSADEGRVGAAMLHGRKRYADELTAGTLPRLYGAGEPLDWLP